MKLHFVFVFILLMPICSSAHYVVGIVEDAKDGTDSNGRIVVMWNPENGITDNITDVVGPTGNSYVDSYYMMDCEMLETSCSVGDELSLKVLDFGDGYSSSEVSVVISGLGFDLAENISLNSPPIILSITVDDSIISPINEIDLISGGTREVTCKIVVEELDGELLQNPNAEFFTTFFGDEDDNNYHYTSSSCVLNSSYGNENQTEIICSFDIWYYANSEEWTCYFEIEDSNFAKRNSTDTTFVNQLLSLELNSSINFGSLDVGNVSEEVDLEIINRGNVKVNLSLSGYGTTENDGHAMDCTGGYLGYIPIEYQKYNLTNSIYGELTKEELEIVYRNLTSDSEVREFNLNSRQDDSVNDAIDSTYWRVYVPEGISGSCQGNIVVGAVVEDED